MLALGAVAVAAAAGFGMLAAAVARRDTLAADAALLQAAAPPEDHPARQAAEAIGPVGKKWSYVPAALGTCAVLLATPGARRGGALRSRVAGAAAVLAASATARWLNPVLDNLPQPPAPPGRDSPTKPVFPSGHAFGPGTVALSSAYVLAREGIVRPGSAFPVALAVPVVLAGGRVLEEKHWASDVLGGYLGAVALASVSMAAYEAVRAG